MAVVIHRHVVYTYARLTFPFRSYYHQHIDRNAETIFYILPEPIFNMLTGEPTAAAIQIRG